MMKIENVEAWSDAELKKILLICERMFKSGLDVETGAIISEEDYKQIDEVYLICENELNKRKVAPVDEIKKKENCVTLNPLLLLDDDIYEDTGIKRKRNEEDAYCF